MKKAVFQKLLSCNDLSICSGIRFSMIAVESMLINLDKRVNNFINFTLGST